MPASFRGDFCLAGSMWLLNYLPPLWDGESTLLGLVPILNVRGQGTQSNFFPVPDSRV